MSPVASPRVVHFNTSYGWGGGEQQVFELVRGSRAAGVHATLFARGRGALLDRCRDLPGVDVRPFDFGWKYSPVTITRLCRALRDARADVLAVHDSRATNAGVLAATAMRLPIVLHRRISSPVRRGFPSRWIYRAPCIHRYIAVSESARRGLLSGGIDRAETRVVLSGLDLDRVLRCGGRSAMRRELGFGDAAWFGVVGALEVKKDVETFLRAAGRLVRVHPNTRFLVVGEGPRRQRLERLARAEGLGARVRFVGAVPQASRWIAALDGLVFPSRREGHPAVLKEAMILGVPVLAAITPGTMEVCPPETCWYFPPGNDEACAKMMGDLLDPNAEAKMRIAGARRYVAENFPIHRMVNATCNIYRGVAGRREVATDWPITPSARRGSA